MTNSPAAQDITRTTLGVLFIGILIAASFWVLRPFMTAIVWATMIVIATWPMMLALEKRLLGKRGLAVLVMTLLLLLVLVIPLTMAIISVVDRADEIAGWGTSLVSSSIPPPPAWLEQIPVVGPKLAARWNHFATQNVKELSAQLTPYAGKIVNWIVDQGGNMGRMIFHFLLTVVVSAVLYSTGESAAAGVRRFARRLAGRHGEDAVILGAKAVRGVALGVVGTAAIQSLLGGAGLLVAGIPAAAVFTAIMFVCCVAQIGPGLILIPAIIWLLHEGMNVSGSIMIAWSLFVMTIDNVIRPFLIKKGADLPLLLIFSGVLGGLVAFGIIGLFIGPVVLAVTYTLLEAWVTENETAEEQPLPETE